MALFDAAIRRDSFPLLRLPFLCHVQVFLCKISLVCRLKCLYSCFSSYFCFLIIFILLMLVLSVLFQVAVISLSPCFLCSFLVVVSMLSSPLPPFFLDTYNLSMSSLGCIYYYYYYFTCEFLTPELTGGLSLESE